MALVAIGAAAATCLFMGVAHAQADAPTMVLGIGGTHRTSAWTPVVIRLPKPAAGPVRLAVEDPDGQWVSSPPVIPADGGLTARATVRPGRPNGRVRVHSTGQGGGTVLAELDASPNQTTRSTTPLLLLAGNLPAVASATRLVADERVAMQVVPLPASLETGLFRPRDLDAFDAAIVCGTAMADIDTAIIDGLDGWVRRGGRLVLCAGASAISLAKARGPAAEWLPGADPRLVPLRKVGAIEAYARTSGLATRLPAAGLMVPRFESPRGVIDVFEGSSATEMPLVVRRAHGFGTITWIGIDLDAPWCANWPGCDRLLAALLGGRKDVDAVVPAASDSTRRVPDLAGQLRVALDTFPAEGGRKASQPVPFEIIAAVGLLYCLTLYPLDWWLIRRAGRPWLSWFTLPLAAGGFAAAAWGLGGAWGRDDPARARSADIIDFDAVSGLVRGSAWAAVRSPENGCLDIGVAASGEADIPDADASVSWFADRAAGFGGVDAAMAHPSLAAADYGYGQSLADLVDVPIAAASSRLFEAEWTGKARTTIAESTLTRNARGLLTGHVTSRLPCAIEQCWLLYGGWLYDVGRMERGDTFDTDAGRGPRSLAAAVTRRTAIGDRDRAERWDAASTSVGRILEVAGLHAAAGAESYTGLAPGRLGRLDLSPLLATDRAILFGTLASGPVTTWKVRLKGDETAADLPVDAGAATIVRVVIPVGPATSGEPTP